MPKKQAPSTVESTLFKHQFGKAMLSRVAKEIAAVYPKFDSQQFLALMPLLEGLEMKARVLTIRDELKRQLPEEYAEAVKILLAAAAGNKISGFALWPFTEYVQTYGLDHRPLSLNVLKELTPLFTAEFAVRPFLRLYPAETLKFLGLCATAKDVHLRRWASEGSRPRLPWGERLQAFVKDPSPTLPILELLKFDDELYVRKSVANHLNDIAKDHPDFVLKVLGNWRKEAAKGNGQKIEWIIHRALRSLIKAGHPEALKLIDVDHEAEIKVVGLKINQKAFQMGDRLEFDFTVQSLSDKTQKLVIDYVVHYMKSNQRRSPRVFKLKTVMLPGGQSLRISKSHHLKAVTTRVHYSGVHWLEIQVNGSMMKRVQWHLQV